MIDELLKVARPIIRNEIIDGLARCTAAQVIFFKRMYAGGKLERSVRDVVGKMSDEQLNTAVGQVRRTLAKMGGE